jgi:hypothetical protein
MSNTKLVIDILVAIGTLAVAVMAIWGDKVRSWLSPPKLIIQAHNLRGAPTTLTLRNVVDPSGGQRAIYYHLKVVNVRPWLTVNNCRVLLTGIARRGPDGQFHNAPMAVPFQFVWAPARSLPEQLTITKERVLDFASICEGKNSVCPSLYEFPNDFQGYVRSGEAVRYQIEIDASNFVSKKPQYFEIAWDGEWCFEVDQMERHLKISEFVKL